MYKSKVCRLAVILHHLLINVTIIVSGCDSHVILSCYYRTPVDRDYNKIIEQDCSQVVTHYGENKFGGLTDVAIAPTGEVVIVDYGNGCVVVLDNKLSLLKLIGQSGNNKLVTPDGVAVTDNVIAVVDWGSDQVKKYSLQGELLSVIGCHGNKNGQFNGPRGLAFNNNKWLYVVDGDNHRVQVFQQYDKFVFSFGNKGNNPGQFQCPVRIVIDPNNNNVLITDIYGDCIHLFTRNGRFIQTINSNGLYAVTISPTGYLITSHYGDDNKIRVCSPTHQLINQFGKKGSKKRILWYSWNGYRLQWNYICCRKGQQETTSY